MSHYMNGQLSLLPEPPFAPRWPNPKSLPGLTLTRILTGERLNQITFGLHRWRLAAYIMSLRYMGWPIQSGEVCAPGYGSGGLIAEYWLPPEIIVAAKAVRP
jgi:hypothetical protein